MSQGDDLKDKFSYVEFKGGSIDIKSPLENMSEYIAKCFNKEFSTIGEDKWNIT